MSKDNSQTNIYDEANYYEEGWTDKTEKLLNEYWDGYNKVIGGLAGKLKEAFGSENVIYGADINK